MFKDWYYIGWINERKKELELFSLPTTFILNPNKTPHDTWLNIEPHVKFKNIYNIKNILEQLGEGKIEQSKLINPWTKLHKEMQFE